MDVRYSSHPVDGGLERRDPESYDARHSLTTPNAGTGSSRPWASRSAASWASSGFPETLTLSVVIPVYNEKSDDPRNPPAGARGPDQEADHRGRRLLDRRHPRDPQRARKARAAT